MTDRRRADDGPVGHADERDLLLDWLDYLRSAVLRNVEGLTDEQARWTPDGALLPLVGIVNHLTHVEWRWIDGGLRGADVDRSEAEFHPDLELTIAAAVAAYRERAATTDAAARAMSLDAPCRWVPDGDLRWVLIHLINETARHAGHAGRDRASSSTGRRANSRSAEPAMAPAAGQLVAGLPGYVHFRCPLGLVRVRGSVGSPREQLTHRRRDLRQNARNGLGHR